MTGQFLSPIWHRVAHLKPRLHAHAQIARHRDRGRSWYTVRNAATGQVYRFSPSVYRLLHSLDGNRTIDEAWQEAAEQLDDAAPGQGEVLQLLTQLHDADLLRSDLMPDTAELVRRRAQLSRRNLWGRLGNPMALRFPLWNPDRFLERTLPAVRPLVGRFGLILWAMLVLPGLVLAGMHWAELTDGAADRILATENLLLMAMVFPVLKALHEMGHAYAVKAGGGAVHELGIMILVLLPMPYVDATASAAFRSRWRRIGVGAAGMLVETAVAALAMMLWAASEPGSVRAVLFAVMTAAGISTVLFNGNPLLRYDGYYILSDLLGIPNLTNRASKYWAWLVQHYAFGLKDPAPETAPGERRWLLAYAPAAFVCRSVMAVSIAMLVAERFSTPGILVAIWMVIASFAVPFGRMIWHLLASPQLAPRRGRAIAVSIGAAAAVAAAVGLVPVPLHSMAEGIVMVPEESTVRAGVDGFVRRLVAAPGSIVEAGALLAESDDPDIDAAIAAARARVAAVQARITAQQFDDRVEAALADRELAVEIRSLTRAMQKQAALATHSAVAGTFIVPKAEDVPGHWFKRGEIVGYVLPQDMRIARVVVDQEHIGLVRDRARGAEVRLATDLAHVYPATLIREVPAGSQELPSAALATEGGGSYSSDPRERRKPLTLNRTFQLDVALPALAAAGAGSHVWVRLDHGAEPVYLRGWRIVRQTLLSHFDA